MRFGQLNERVTLRALSKSRSDVPGGRMSSHDRGSHRFTRTAMLPADQPSPPSAPAPSTPEVPLPRTAPPPRSTSRDRWAEQAHPDSGASLSRETCVFRPQKRPEEININQNNPPVRRSNPSHRTNSDGNNRFFTKLFSRVHKAN